MKIKMLVMDVDGTLTDGKIYMSNSGEIMKAFDVKDGYGICKILPQEGIIPVIITGRQSLIVRNRASELGIEQIFQGVNNKEECLSYVCAENRLDYNEIAYIGDDDNDLTCMKKCGMVGCPCDASDNVKIIADFISEYSGGRGAVRDFIYYIVKRNIEVKDE